MYNSQRIALLCLLLATFSSRANSVPADLVSRPDESLLWAPQAIFRRELDQLAFFTSREFRAVPTKWNQDERVQSAEVEETEINAVLDGLWASRQIEQSKTRPSEGWASDDQSTETLQSFLVARRQIDALRTKPSEKPLELELLKGPQGFPAEFAEYLRGLGEFASGDLIGARARWETMLSWPESQRKRRSVWAAYMISKSWLDTSPDPTAWSENAIAWSQKTRELAKAGFSDPLGLAAASLCIEASAEWAMAVGGPPLPGDVPQGPKSIASKRAEHIIRAIHLYLQAYGAGQTHADEALQHLCKDLLDKQPQVLSELTQDGNAAGVVTAFILARGGKLVPVPRPQQVKLWLDAVKSASPHPGNSQSLADRLGPDRLLQACYEYNLDAKTAAEWRSRSVGMPLSDWMWAKMCLAGGASHIDEAAALLASAAAGFSKHEVWADYAVRGGYYDDNGQRVLVPRDRVNAELGVLELAHGRYETALDLLLRAGWWDDATYIAECVLTPDELAAYVDANWPPSGVTAPLAANKFTSLNQAGAGSDRGEQIRGVLARRLTRLGRWKQARPYFAPTVQLILDSYVAAIRGGHDADRSDDDRAESLWTAARVARFQGLELFEHESDPARGMYERFSGHPEYYPQGISDFREHLSPRVIFGATPEELKRASANTPKLFSRYEVRYIAADHAWSAAQLMPDESDETARILCTAGNWVINLDRKSASRYYRALIDRCGTTELGRQAASMNGLPSKP